MGTNRYHNHTESKYIRLARDCINPFEDLWRDARHSIPVFPSRGVNPANDQGELKIRQASATVVINENIGLPNDYRYAQHDPKKRLPFSNFRVLHGLREYIRGLRPHPTPL